MLILEDKVPNANNKMHRINRWFSWCARLAAVTSPGWAARHQATLEL